MILIGIGKSIKHAWSRFTNGDQPITQIVTQKNFEYGSHFGVRPGRVQYRHNIDKHQLVSIQTKIAIDVSDVKLNHVRLDNNEKFVEEINSELNLCLNVEANLDQAARQFRQDIVMTLLDEGVCAIVPTVTTHDPNKTSSYDIREMRVGTIVEWFPEHVRVKLWNPIKGRHDELIVHKREAAIVENPFYAVMNEPNSTMKRLMRKFAVLDEIDDQYTSGKLNLILQTPNPIRSEAQRKLANDRVRDIEFQISQGRYGIAYIDGSENLTQLNRSLENGILEEIKHLTDELRAELGVTESILNGSASEQELLNYTNRTIKPFVEAISEAMTRTFLTKTARAQKQAITFFRDPFAFVPLGNMAEIADKFSRNAILTPNEIRGIIGMRPIADPEADVLKNRNMPDEDQMSILDEPLPPLEEGQNEI